MLPIVSVIPAGDLNEKSKNYHKAPEITERVS
jgi:hypothetical protein